MGAAAPRDDLTRSPRRSAAIRTPPTGRRPTCRSPWCAAWPPTPTPTSAGRRTRPSSPPGSRSPCRWPPRSTGPRARRWCSTAGGAGPTLWSRPCSPTTSTAPPSTRMHEAVRDVAARLPPLPPGQGRRARPRRRPGPTWPLASPWSTCSPPAGRRADRPRVRLVATPPSHVRRVVRDVLAVAGRAGPSGPSTSEWIDAEPRAGKVGGAFCMPVARRRVAGAAQLRRLVRQRADARPRARATPTTTANLAERTPLQRQTPDGAGRDGQHLLRDHRRRGRPGRRPPADRAARHPRHRPAGRQPGGGRHPQPVPVRVASCAAGASGRPCRSPS